MPSLVMAYGKGSNGAPLFYLQDCRKADMMEVNSGGTVLEQLKRDWVSQVLLGGVVFVISGACCIFGYLGLAVAPARRTIQIPTVSPVPVTPTRDIIKLEFVSTTGTSSDRYFKVEGLVKNNTTNETCGFVEVIIEYYDAGGGFITSDQTYLDHTAIEPGQTSPFSVLTRREDYYPEFDTYEVSLQTDIGCFPVTQLD